MDASYSRPQELSRRERRTDSRVAAPVVSVIIPTYNRISSIIRAVDSVLSQTFADLELIVVDDRSTDGTWGVLQMLIDPRVRLLRTTCNSGPAAARNIGIAAARGQYVAFLDSDDVWAQRKLEVHLAFVRSTGARLSCTAYRYVTSGEVIALRNPGDRITREHLLVGCNCSPGSTLLAERSLFDEVGVFNEEMRRLEDWEWLLRCSVVADIEVLPAAMSTIEARVSGGTLYPQVKAAQKHLGRTLSAIQANAKSKRFLKAVLAYELAAVAYIDGRLHLAVLQFLRALIASPGLVRSTISRVVHRVAGDIGRRLPQASAQAKSTVSWPLTNRVPLPTRRRT